MIQFIKRKLKKSQMSLFDSPTHTEVHRREGHTRHLANGTSAIVSATMAKVKVRGQDSGHPKHGEKVYYKTPGMPRKKRGTIVGGSHEQGYTVKPVREGYVLNPPHIEAVSRDHIWTPEEHAAESAPKGTGGRVTAEESTRRASVGMGRLGLSEAEILSHPVIVDSMKRTLQHLAARNGYNPHFVVANGVLHNDDPAANELFSEYIMAAMGALRTAGASASDADIEQFKAYLAGETSESTMAQTIARTGKTAAMRHLIADGTRLRETTSYDTQGEDDYETGMRTIAAKAAVVQKEDTQQAMAVGIEEQLDALDDKIGSAIIKMKFGLGAFTHGYKEQDIAAALNRSGVRSEAVDRWDADSVKAYMQQTLVRMAGTRGVQHLRDFLKSLREETDLRKSHVKQYNKKDGTQVSAYNINRKSTANHQDYSGDKNPSWKGGDIEVTCAGCGKTVSKDRHTAKKYVEEGKTYRCQPCHHKFKSGENSSNWAGGDVTVTCTKCGAQKTERAGRAKIFNSRPGGYRCIHCKPSAGEENPNWSGGDVKQTCVDCGKTTTMNKFRAKPYLEEGKAYRCSPCHQKFKIKENHPNWNGGNIEISCTKCGKTQSVPRSRAEKLQKPLLCSDCVYAERRTGEDSANWKGGKSFEPYSSGWNAALKRRIKERDNHTCQLCGDDQRKDRRLETHHIDYDKNNLSEDNLTSLCKPCHAKTGANREKWTAHFKANELMDKFHLIKSHIRQYAKQDGTVVTEHNDKRILKHQVVLAHQNKHGEEIHSGATLKHGDELAASLKEQGWKERTVHQTKPIEGHQGGKKEDMPVHEDIPGKNRENGALQTAERSMKKMREAAAASDDPVGTLQSMNTSRSNTYTEAVDNYREKLLNHYGHNVDRNSTATKYDKDGHTIIMSKVGDTHTVHYAGGDPSKDKGAITSLAGRKEVQSVDTGAKEPTFIMGRANKAYTAKLNEVASKYALVEAEELTTSHTIQGHVNRAYPQDIQPRERERLSSQMQMANIMNDVKPELFGHSATASDGAPIVGKDGAVESGNGRTIALGEAYKRGLADKYKAWLKSEAEHFGLKPEDVEGMSAPMLVRVRDEDDKNTDRAEFAREANQSSNLGSSPAEQAWSDSERIDDALLKKFTADEDGEIYNDDNMEFINGFLDKLGKNEAASLRDGDGDPNKKAIERIQNAVFTKVYGSSMLTELQAESAKPKIRNVMKALNSCVGDFAQIKGHDDLDVVPDMMEAIEYTLSHQGQSKAELEHTLRNAGALDFTGDTPTFKTEHSVNMILAIADRSGSRNRIENVFRAISNGIKNEVAERENPEVDMFAGPSVPKTKEQVVKQALDKVDRSDDAVQKSFQRQGLTHLIKSHGGTNGRIERKGKVRPESEALAKSACGCGPDGRCGCGESKEGSCICKKEVKTDDGLRLLKSHIKTYTRKNGSVVTAHEDSRKAKYATAGDKERSKQVVGGKPFQMIPAMRLPSGAILVGRFFGDHYEIADRAKKEYGITGEDDSRWGFVNHQGHFLGRGEAAEYLKEHVPRLHAELSNPDALEAVDYDSKFNFRKSHVAAYTRTTKSGAMAHIEEHEDSRVKRYAVKLARTKDSGELHKLRQERFAHLPHWGTLDDTTKKHILDAEDEAHGDHKHWEKWKEDHLPAKGKQKADPMLDHLPGDHSGMQQARLFKGMLAGTYLLRKSTKGLVLTPTVSNKGQQIHRWKLGEVAEHAGKKTEAAKQQLEQSIYAIKDGTHDKHEGIEILNRTPMILQKLGLPNHKIIISPKKMSESVFTSMHPEGKHGIPTKILRELPEHLHNPMMVFKSKQPGRLVVVTDLMHEGKPIAVVIMQDAQYKRNIINAIASIHPRQIGEVELWIKQDLLRYVNKKKSNSWAQIHGLQLPVMCTSHACSYTPNLLHEEIGVKKKKLQRPKLPSTEEKPAAQNDTGANA